MKKLCQVNPTAKTNRLWNYRLPDHFDCIQFLISHPVVPSHCVECRVSLKADFISGMWSSIYKCTSLLNSSVINIAHQYCMDSGHWTSFQIGVTVSKGFNYEVCTYIGEHFLLVCWLSGLFAVPDPFYEENLFLRTLLYSTWLWLRILISGPSFKFDSVEWCRKLPIPRSIDWDEKFNKTEGKGDGRTSSNIYRLIRPRSKVCVERRLRK